MRAESTKLFSPLHIGTLEVPNRLIRSATAERLATEPMGRATSSLAALYQELARGGVGLIVTGHAFVDPLGKAHPEMLGAHCDQMIPGLSTLAEAVHAQGGKTALQINHAGSRCQENGTPEILAPSAMPNTQGIMPREMAGPDIQAAIDAFGQAARRAKEAGFDAVQIHGAHGYLISQFLSPATNRRTDAWGGDFDRRLRFLSDVCRAMREQVGDSYPILIKLGIADSPETVPGGLTRDDGLRIVSRLSALGLDGVEISGGYGGSQADYNARLGVGTKVPEAYFRNWARQAKAATDLPVALVGGLRTRAVMEEVLATGDADLIALCRPLIREPDLPNRLQSGEATASACISGGRCWAERSGQGIGCKCES
jgi:2,4-dienoyl-CoA reductase-like NADH-dependent reductase (Old Yellow Enzyme family)